jgi:hypothetical protein
MMLMINGLREGLVMIGVASYGSAPSAGRADPIDRPSIFRTIAEVWRELCKGFLDSYRPELHYMRGPGPKWREKHGWAQATRSAAALHGCVRGDRLGTFSAHAVCPAIRQFRSSITIDRSASIVCAIGYKYPQSHTNVGHPCSMTPVFVAPLHGRES